MRNLRRAARRHQAGVDPETYWAFPPGSRVLTAEGILGTVTAVEDGPHAGSEQYVVELDGGLGGGEYGPSELRAAEQPTASKTADLCRDEWSRWQGGGCHAYAVALVQMEPGLTFASLESGNQVVHHFAHNEQWAYDSAGRHPMPYTGVEGLSLTILSPDYPDDYDEAHPDDVADAKEHIRRNGILTGQHTAAKTATSDEARDWDDADREDMEGEGFIDPPYSEDVPGRYDDSHQPAAWTSEAAEDDEYDDDLNHPRLGAQVESELHTAAEDYPELGDILQERPPLPHSERIASKTATVNLGMPHEAGWFTDKVVLPLADKALQAQEESGYGSYNEQNGSMASYDWCRFRRNSRCFFPKELDAQATKQAGHAVWKPIDRGYCPRDKWEEQKACPAPSEPGPKSGERNWRYETWRSWESGGQGRWGSKDAGRVNLDVQDLTRKDPAEAEPTDPAEHLVEDLVKVMDERDQKKSNPYSPGGSNPYATTSALRDGEFTFHVTATWRDVQAKAKRIRSDGKVRVISASPAFLVGEVQGDTSIYQATLHRVPGSQKIAMWECGCAWAAYSWGRSGRWKKYEGRLCSHALALNYEGQSRGWMGGEVTEDRQAPSWRQDQQVKVPGDYQKPEIGEWRTGSRKVAALPPETPMPEVAEWMMAEVAREEPGVTSDLQRIAAEHHGEMHGLEFRLKTYDSLLRKLVDRRAIATDPFAVAYDALRYTIALPEPDWANSVQETLWDLQSKGYTVVSEKNTWQRGDPYSGLHYVIQPPGSEAVFELQFHTSASYNLKEFVLHKMYEEYRNSATPLARRQFLYDEMTKFWDEVPIPANATDFPESSFLLRPVAVSKDLAEAPVHAMVRDMLADGDQPNEVIATLVALGVADAPGLVTQAMSTQPFQVKVRGLVGDVLDLYDDDTAEVRGVGRVRVDEVEYPTYHPTRGLSLFGSKTAARDGYMVAIEPPRAMAEAIYQQMRDLFGDDVEPVTNYHFTLAYPGDADGVDAEDLEAAVRLWANRWGPMTGRLSGYGVFHQEGGDKVLYASIDMPGLENARQDLVKVLAKFGIAIPDEHGFTPHCTLLYSGEANTPTPPQEMPEEAQETFTISEVAVVLGGDWRHVPLGTGGREDIGTGRDIPWGFLPWGGDDLEFLVVHDSGPTLPLQGSPEAAASYVAKKDPTVPPSEHGDPRLQDAGVTVSKDDDGYYVHTHRARSDSYDSVAKIPDSKIEEIEATGARVEALWPFSRAEEFEPAPVAPIQTHEFVGVPPANQLCAICDRMRHYPNHDVAESEMPVAASLSKTADEDQCPRCGEDSNPSIAKDAYRCRDCETEFTGSGQVTAAYYTEDEMRAAGQEALAEYGDAAWEPGSMTAELHEEPEPALPATTGEEDEEPDFVPGDPRLAHLMSGSSPKQQGGEDMNIADAAKAHLAKTALKSFTPAEQKQIIEEGSTEGVVAANLDRLDITGTHYEALEDALQAVEAEPDDTDWLL